MFCVDPIIDQIQTELIAHSDAKTWENFQRFFKEEVPHYGVKSGDVAKIAKRYLPEIKTRKKADIFALCETLYKSGYCEEAFVVSSWMASLSWMLEPDDLPVITSWISQYITNWATCDGFCNHAIGDLIVRYPDTIDEIIKWTRSENRWMRRAASVSLIIPAKHGKFLNEVFVIADLLLTDEDDMVRKGYGWLLKEASREHQQSVFEYVMTHKKLMPRTSLRYAIELMPPDLKKEAMRKDW
ncbi:DNA alkylation repair protein [Methanospirillum sp.]|uniref:DNA alkylation repair protein n=1 Tax=Methanospirillum sp. TaxID=45200 RepID=UPI00345C9F0D